MSLSTTSTTATTTSSDSATPSTSFTTSPSPSSTSITTQPSPSPSASTNSGPFGSSQNYFFGFLITFVVLLVFFLGCGCVSRRRFAARRRGLNELGLIGHGDGRTSTPVEPQYLEPWLAKGETAWSWHNLKVSVITYRQMCYIVGSH